MSSFWEWSKDVSFVNRFIFPAPKPSSYNKNSFPNELIFVPKKERLYDCYKQSVMDEYRNNNNNIHMNNMKTSKLHRNGLNSPKYSSKSSPNLPGPPLIKKPSKFCDEDAIPCIYIERKYRLSEATHLLLYLHGNAEDLGKCYPIIDYIRMKLAVNILAPEYPGYGVHKGEPNENSVREMVQNVYEFIISPYGMNIPPSRVIVYGFSIGSAAALSSTSFNLKRVVIPKMYYVDDSKSNDNDDNLLSYNMRMNESKQYFVSTFLDKCPHSRQEHRVLFPSENNNNAANGCLSSWFYASTTAMNDDWTSGDPFETLPLASLLNILRKGDVEYPTSVNKQELLNVARKHGLIPPLQSCKKANVIRKYSLLIIVCPFASISQVVADKIGVFASYLLSDRFQNIEAIKKVHGPLLIIHGKDDSIIPYQHSIELHKTASNCDIQPSRIELLDGCDHNTMDLRKITSIIYKFFKQQFNLCKTQKNQSKYKISNYNHSKLKYPKTNHNFGRKFDRFNVEIPKYCWLKPENDGVILSEEQKEERKKKQEIDDEEYAFNLFMKQLLHNESMANASASALKTHQSQKLKSFFGGGDEEEANANDNNNNNDVDDDDDDDDANENEAKVTLTKALKIPRRPDSN